MNDSYNIYCDESCHLEHDGSPVMVIGATVCQTAKMRQISDEIRALKSAHGLSPHCEIKWNKVSPSKLEFYVQLVDYFFATRDLEFRALFTRQKDSLNHKAFQQDHDTWYYKMFYQLLEPLIRSDSAYNIFIDIKDTRSESKRALLEQILRTRKRDPFGHVVRRVQQVRSHESEILQLTDLLIGAIGYCNRRLTSSNAKLAVVEKLRSLSGTLLTKSTPLTAAKFNLFLWRPQRNSK